MDQFTYSSSRKPRLNRYRKAPNRKEPSWNRTSVESVERKMGFWNPFVPEEGQGASAFGFGTTKLDGCTFIFGKNGGLGGANSSLNENGKANGTSSDVNGNVNNSSRESSLGSEEGSVFSKIVDEINKLDLRGLNSEKKSDNIDSGLFKMLQNEMRKLDLKSDVDNISKTKEGETSLNLINLVYGESEKLTEEQANFGSNGSRNSTSGVYVDGSKTKCSDGLSGKSSIGLDENLISKFRDELSKMNLKSGVTNNKEGLSSQKPGNFASGGVSEIPTSGDTSSGSERSNKAHYGGFVFGSKPNSKESSNGNSSYLDESMFSKLPDDLGKMNLSSNANVSNFKENSHTKNVFGFENGTNSSKPINNVAARFGVERSGFSDSNVFMFGSGVNSSASLSRQSSINLDVKSVSQLPDDLGKLKLNGTCKISDLDKNKQDHNTSFFMGNMTYAKQTDAASVKPTPLSADLHSKRIDDSNSGVFVFGSGVSSSNNSNQNASIRSDESFFGKLLKDMKNKILTGNVDDFAKKKQDENIFVSGSSTSNSNSEFGSIPIPNSKDSGNCDSDNFVFGNGMKKNVEFGQTSSCGSDEGLFSKVVDDMEKMNFNSRGNIEKSKSGDDVFVFGGNKNSSYFASSGANQVPKETAKSNFGIDTSAQSIKNGSSKFEFGVKNDNQVTNQNGNAAFPFGPCSVNHPSNTLENHHRTGSFPNRINTGSFPDSPTFFSAREPPIMNFKMPLTKEALFPEIHQDKSFSTKKGNAKKTIRMKKNDIPRDSVPIYQNCSMKITPKKSETEVKMNVNSNGDCSPMDCSPYPENLSTDQYSRKTSVASEDAACESGSCNEREEMLVSEAQKLNINVDSASVDDQVKTKNTSLHNESRTSSEVPVGEDIGGSKFVFTSSTTQIPVPAAKPNFRRKDKLKAGHNLSSSSSGSKVRIRSSPRPDLIPCTNTSVFDSVNKNTELPPKNKIENENGRSQECDARQETSNSNNGSVAAKVLCEKWRYRGNQAYANGDLTKAEECYTRGVKSISSKEISSSCIRPLTLCYSNRAATRMSLGKIREALKDCKMAMSLEPAFLKARVRAANCHLALGDVGAALKQFKNCLQAEKVDSSDQKYIDEALAGLEKAQKVTDLVGHTTELLPRRTSADASKALNLMNEALSLSPHSESLLKMKTEALMMMRSYNEVIKLCEGTLELAEKNSYSPSNNVCSSAKLWRSYMIAKSYFHLGKLEESLELLQKDEKSNPTADKTSELSCSLLVTIRQLLRLKTAGNEAFQAARHSEAVEYYTSAIACNAESRPFTAVCFCNRAAAFQALGQITDAIADCSLAIALDAGYAKAISRRATLHEMIRDYGHAANDLNRLVSLLQKQVKEMGSQSPSLYTELKRSRARLVAMEEKSRKEISLNMYMILGVEKTSSAVDIKKAYRKAALRHHPDKAGQSLVRGENGDDELWREVVAEVHADADRLFKMIGEAYTTLSDPSKHQQYDEEEEMRTYHGRSYNDSSSRYSSEAYHGNHYHSKSYWRRTQRW